MPLYEDIKFVPRGRGTVLCLEDKDYYRQTKYASAQSLWRCSNYVKFKCVGSLKISLEEKKILKYKEHNEDCNNNKRVVVDKVVSACVEQACSGEDTVPAVYKKVVSSFCNEGDDFVSEIPSFKQIKSTVYRRRNEHFKVSKTCDRDVQTLQIPSQFSDIVLADCNDSDGRIIIFSSKEQIQELKDIKTVLCDGTFEVCPEPFEQLYSLHGDIGSSEEFTNIVPLLYILLTNKTKKTYVKMFNMVKSVLPMFDPTEIISDFEKAFIAAANEVFPNAKHHGCYFHFTRAVHKYAETKLKLTKEDIFLQRIVSLCTALPLLPENMLKDG